MKQIKTIKNRLDNVETFDAEVNKSLKEGWKLMKRDVLQPNSQGNDITFYTMLYAELEKEVEGNGTED